MRKIDSEEMEAQVLEDLYQQCISQMLDEPGLTAEEKQELLRQLELSDEEWKLTELPEGAEPLSETIIRMRRGSRG